MKLVFYWDGSEETYEGETWKECCEECVSQEENWDRELTKIVMESQTGNMEDAPEQLEESYNFYSKNWGASAVGMVNRILFDSEGVAWNGELQA